MEDILDFNTEQREYVAATNGQRLANYIIDLIVIYLLVFVFVIGFYSMGTIDEEVFLENSMSQSTGDVLYQQLVEWIVGIVVILIYYGLTEGLLKGKSIGKYLTKTRTVTINNKVADMSTILLRSLCRVVPFEAFSFLGGREGGWHDHWSKTRVIQDEHWEA